MFWRLCHLFHYGQSCHHQECFSDLMFALEWFKIWLQRCLHDNACYLRPLVSECTCMCTVKPPKRKNVADTSLNVSLPQERKVIRWHFEFPRQHLRQIGFYKAVQLKHETASCADQTSASQGSLGYRSLTGSFWFFWMLGYFDVSTWADSVKSLLWLTSSLKLTVNSSLQLIT